MNYSNNLHSFSISIILTSKKVVCRIQMQPNIFSALKPVYLFSKYLGIVDFSLNNESIEFSKRSNRVTTICLVITSFFVVYCLCNATFYSNLADTNLRVLFQPLWYTILFLTVAISQKLSQKKNNQTAETY